MTNLLTLPTEVIDLISGNFCTCQLCNSSDETRAYQETRRALCALSATCRILRHLVQPFLYHRVYPFHGQVEFARTLVDSPRLAACVRELYYPVRAYEDRSKRPIYPSVNPHAYTNPRWFEVVDPDKLNQRLSEQPGGYYDEEGQETGRGQIGRPRAWQSIDDFLQGSCVLENCLLIRTLKMAPELQVLFLWSNLDDLAASSFCLPPALLPRLKELRIFPYTGRGWMPIHPEIPSLAAATPMLESFHYFRAERMLLERHQNVSELVLTNSNLGQYETFVMIASGFPRLQKLTYTEGSSDFGRPRTLTLRAICKALEPIAGTLEVFNIELLRNDRNILLETDHSISLHDSYRGGLSEMRSLRHLRINEACIKDLMAKGQDVLLFSSSLTHLEVSLRGMPSAVYLQLQHWAPKCREYCPKLERVRLCGALQDIQSSQASNLGSIFRNGQVASDFIEEADLDELLLRAHKLDSEGVTWHHDHPPGWEFWNPYVEPMTLADQTEYYDSG